MSETPLLCASTMIRLTSLTSSFSSSGLSWASASCPSASSGRVESRLSPVLPHQTVHALLAHTAFRCSSHQGMHIHPPILLTRLRKSRLHLKFQTRKIRQFLLGLGTQLPP